MMFWQNCTVWFSSLALDFMKQLVEGVKRALEGKGFSLSRPRFVCWCNVQSPICPRWFHSQQTQLQQPELLYRKMTLLCQQHWTLKAKPPQNTIISPPIINQKIKSITFQFVIYTRNLRYSQVYKVNFTGNYFKNCVGFAMDTTQ